MRFVVAYDITDDSRRNRASRTLLDYGERVQYSLFEIDLEPKTLQKLLAELTAILDSSDDNLKIYRLCGSCSVQIVNFGKARPYDPPQVWVL